MEPALLVPPAHPLRRRAVVAGLLALTLVLALAAGAVLTFFGGTRTDTAINPVPAACGIPLVVGDAGTVTAEQTGNAHTITDVGRRASVPPRGWVVALATALQESGLRNLSYGDRDSLGLFQQRPSQGWGTPDQIMQPEYAAGMFYQHLQAIPGWQQLPVTVAAQAVQRSAFPDAYARWEALAAALVRTLAGADPNTCLAAPGAWVVPTVGVLTSTFGLRWGKLHAGIDLAGGRGTPIYVAADGLVVTARCDSPYCDHDGGLAVPGYGNMVDIQHTGGILTRYGHMERFVVQPGQQVRAGQLIGYQGATGNASGVHLHFEVRIDGQPVDPIPFLAAHGVRV